MRRKAMRAARQRIRRSRPFRACGRREKPGAPRVPLFGFLRSGPTGPGSRGRRLVLGGRGPRCGGGPWTGGAPAHVWRRAPDGVKPGRCILLDVFPSLMAIPAHPRTARASLSRAARQRRLSGALGHVRAAPGGPGAGGPAFWPTASHAPTPTTAAGRTPPRALARRPWGRRRASAPRLPGPHPRTVGGPNRSKSILPASALSARLL